MARIQLRDALVRFKDGLAGAAALNGSGVMPADTDIDINMVDLNTDDVDLVPIGARFIVAGESTPLVHVVTGRTGNPTTNIQFSPALGAGTYMNGALLTFLSQQIDIKMGDGNLTYTENDEYEYELDRDRLDTVRKGADQPMEINIDAVYEAITTGTGETIAPMDALKRRGAASEWVSSAEDKCEPYAIDIEVIHSPSCGTKQAERTIFPDFRSESREVNFQDATISVTGRCNATEPIVDRGAY